MFPFNYWYCISSTYLFIFVCFEIILKISSYFLKNILASFLKNILAFSYWLFILSQQKKIFHSKSVFLRILLLHKVIPLFIFDTTLFWFELHTQILIPVKFLHNYHTNQSWIWYFIFALQSLCKQPLKLVFDTVYQRKRVLPKKWLDNFRKSMQITFT